MRDLHRVDATGAGRTTAGIARPYAQAVDIFNRALPKIDGAGRLKVMAEPEYQRIYGGA